MYFNVLKEVSAILNKLNCLWAVGGSLVLYNKGLWECPNDIDILINFKDVEKVKNVMDVRYEKLELKYKDSFKTKAFFGYKINGINIEFMGDFKIISNDNVYSFLLDEKTIVDKMDIGGVKVNVSSLEDWIVAYYLMGDPKGRVPIIKEYFIKNGVENMEILERALKQKVSKNLEYEMLNLM
ncbi:hypothetical protein [Clostridium senegalense]|uniref:Nucleotidyltransferase family protein n=1 Tax=Clostridium senegalense TaxID=1465809 RepID=A0A6M0H2F7_9CLOT|nr:hypothetical protein [Clostridium senegalense]NEU04905.1 hypothetical protein [Clostridium senegalense]